MSIKDVFAQAISNATGKPDNEVYAKLAKVQEQLSLGGISDKLTHITNPNLANGREVLKSIAPEYNDHTGRGTNDRTRDAQQAYDSTKFLGQENRYIAEKAFSDTHSNLQKPLARKPRLDAASAGYGDDARTGMASRLTEMVSTTKFSQKPPAVILGELDRIRDLPIPKGFSEPEKELLVLAKETLHTLETGEGKKLPEEIVANFNKQKANTQAKAAAIQPLVKQR